MNATVNALRARTLEESIALRAPVYRPSPGWRERRACNGRPLAWWYDANLCHRGRNLCAACPVRIDCATATITAETDIEVDHIVGHCAVSAATRRQYRLTRSTT